MHRILNPRSDYIYRLIRPENMSTKKAEGWLPVKQEMHNPEDFADIEWNGSHWVGRDGKKILVYMSKANAKARQDALEKKNKELEKKKKGEEKKIGKSKIVDKK